MLLHRGEIRARLSSQQRVPQGQGWELGQPPIRCLQRRLRLWGQIPTRPHQLRRHLGLRQGGTARGCLPTLALQHLLQHQAIFYSGSHHTDQTICMPAAIILGSCMHATMSCDLMNTAYITAMVTIQGRFTILPLHISNALQATHRFQYMICTI